MIRLRRLRNVLGGYLVPLGMVGTWFLFVALSINDYPSVRFTIYAVSVVLLALGMSGLLRQARDHIDRTGEDPPLFLIALFWQKVAIIFVEVCFMASASLKILGRDAAVIERFTLSGQGASTVAIALVSLLLFLGTREGRQWLSTPTNPGVLRPLVDRRRRPKGTRP